MTDTADLRVSISRLREQAQAADEWIGSDWDRLALEHPSSWGSVHTRIWSPLVVLALLDDWTRRLDRDEATLDGHPQPPLDPFKTMSFCRNCALHGPCLDYRRAVESVADLARLIDTINGNGETQ